MERFLVVRFSSLGDIVLASVVTQQLKQKYPLSRITFLTKTKYELIARLLPGVSRVIGYDSSESLLLFIHRLKQDKFDGLVDLHDNWRSFWVRRLVSADRKLKYRSHRLKRNVMVRLPLLPIQPLSTVQSYLRSLTDLGIQSSALEPRLVTESQDQNEAQNFLTERGVPPGAFLIGIAPGAKWESKRWHLERFAQVSVRLQQIYQARVIFFGSQLESDLIISLAEQVPGSLPAVNLEFNLVAALTQKCGLMICNDSGLMHISSALKVPTVAIFGPTHPRLGFALVGAHCVVLTTNQPCSPCSLHGEKKCFQPVRFCMDNISMEMVLEAARNLLHQEKPVLIADES